MLKLIKDNIKLSKRRIIIEALTQYKTNLQNKKSYTYSDTLKSEQKVKINTKRLGKTTKVEHPKKPNIEKY